MSDLHASTVRDRISAAARYSVFANGIQPPARWLSSWQRTLENRRPAEGQSWPADLARATAADVWPAHAFGTANAPILVLWHRPGLERDGGMRAPWIDPPTPVLGGVGHAHVERFVPDALASDRSWDLLHRWLGLGLTSFNLPRPWAAVMVACLNDILGDNGAIDARRNRAMLAPGARVDQICSTTRPLLVLACGTPVRSAISATG